jgi:superfamily I DNA and/or RNA helicase
MTLGTLLTRGEDLPDVRTALLDEAGQVSEPAAWGLVGRVRRVLMAGDPHQLGPVVVGRDPTLETSLLQRLVAEGFPFPMLTEQRRMHGTLMALIQPTYGGRLTAAAHVATRSLPVESPWNTHPARFVDTAGMGHDEARDAHGSVYNLGEASLLARIWRELRDAGVRPDQVGVVAPYRAQVAQLRQVLPELEVATVNAFQGREVDVLLASFTRSNPDGELGFVADARRLNVTLSRARSLFIGVGDSATLGTSPLFARLVERVGDGYLSGWELPEES